MACTVSSVYLFSLGSLVHGGGRIFNKIMYRFLLDVCKFGQSFKLLALYGCKKLNCKDELKYNFHVTRSCYDHAARSSHILKDEE